MQSFYAPGKILLNGEYTVLVGFEGMALPVKCGQWLDSWVFNTPAAAIDTLYYQALDENDQPWFQLSVSLDDLLPSSDIISTDKPVAETFLKLLNLVPDGFFESGKSIRLVTRLEFNRNSGLGSSSTFVALMSQFFGLNAQWVQAELFGGSGYDVAIAQVQKPLVFWRNQQGVHFRPWKLSSSLTQQWHIVFWGDKVNSRNSSAAVKETLDQLSADTAYKMQLEKILSLTRDAQDIPTLETSLEMMQMFLSQLLGLETPYQSLGLKPVSQGLCKWLGAWGGDMLLVNKKILQEYPSIFKNKTVVAWNDWVIPN